jgi:hypothetical protein
MSALYFGVDVVFLLKTKNDYKMNNSGLHGQYHEIFDLQLFFPIAPDSSLVSHSWGYFNWSLTRRCMMQRRVKSYRCSMQQGVTFSSGESSKKKHYKLRGPRRNSYVNKSHMGRLQCPIPMKTIHENSPSWQFLFDSPLHNAAGCTNQGTKWVWFMKKKLELKNLALLSL